VAQPSGSVGKFLLNVNGEIMMGYTGYGDASSILTFIKF